MDGDVKLMDFVKVLKLNQKNLELNNVINVTEKNVVKVGTNNFLIKTLETYNNKNFKNDELVTEFIKINLPKDNEELAHKQWFDGIIYEGHTYKAWFATVGGMKQEDNTRKYKGICETIFIREDFQYFSELVECIISLGKFNDLESLDDTAKEKIICINKDVLSRISLITSDFITEIDMPNIIILPQPQYHIIKDYKTVKPKKSTVEETNKKGETETVEKVDYDLIDLHFNDEIDIFDGGAIATPKVFESIGNTLKRNDIEFAIIRGYGMAIKGLITKFDILGYLELMYKETGNTDYCRKVNGKFELLDRWNEWQEVTDNTMLLNESMVKLAKYFSSMDEYKTRLEKLNNEQWGKYHNILNKLYITKVNKADKNISSYRRLNYQLINALALTVNNYTQLIKQDYKLFKKILNPYDCVKGEKDTVKFVENIDYINIFFKQCTNINSDEDDEKTEDDLQEKLTNVVNKAQELININPEFIKLDYVKRNLRSLIEKKIRELICGKVTVKAKYQYIAVDPISYLNWAMTRHQGNNGLAEGQFYSADCNDEEIRTVARNPLSAYSEVHNVKFVRNPFLNNYLSPCRELIYFNQKSDILSLMSSADTDGDACTVIDDEIIRNAVVIPKDGKYFITQLDGHKEELLYNKENRFISTYRASGNLIGKIAIKSPSVNCNCQISPQYYDTVNNKYIYKEKFLDDMDFTKEQGKKYIELMLLSKEWLYATEERFESELKELITQNFYDYEKEIYILLYNTMSSIDAPKTLTMLGKEYTKILDDKYEKNVYFLQYRKNEEDVKKRDYCDNDKDNLLDRFASGIEFKLLKIIKDSKKEFKDRAKLLQEQLKNDNWCKETYDLCKKEIDTLYSEYTQERLEAEKECKEANHKDSSFYLTKERFDKLTKRDYEDWNYCKILNKRARYVRYKEIDQKYYTVANYITKTFDIDTVSQVIANMEKCTENFILSLFFSCLKCKGTRYIYQKCDDGDIEYLYEKYKKEAKDFDNSSNIEKLVEEDKIRLKLEQKLRFRLLNKDIIEEIKQALENDTSYELNLSDKRVQAFDDYKDFLKDKVSVNIVKFDTKKDGSLAIAEKSFGVIVKC